jgi:hypothetical protein
MAERPVNRPQGRSQRRPRTRDQQYKTPQGTIVLMVVFIILIVALWGMAYITMLSRGGTF